MENTLSKKNVQAKPKQKAKLSVGSVSLILLLTFLALVTLIPFLWMISASFKTNNDVFSVPIQWIPKSWHPENYVDFFQEHSFFEHHHYLDPIVYL